MYEQKAKSLQAFSTEGIITEGEGLSVLTARIGGQCCLWQEISQPAVMEGVHNMELEPPGIPDFEKEGWAGRFCVA